MAEQPLDAAIAALRYALARLDEVERQVSGAGPSAATFTMPLDAMPALADLAIGARCALAENLGIADPGAQRQVTRQLLESELQTHTIAAAEAGLSEPAAPAAAPQPAQLLAPGAELDPKDGAQPRASRSTRRGRRSPNWSRRSGPSTGRWPPGDL